MATRVSSTVFTTTCMRGVFAVLAGGLLLSACAGAPPAPIVQTRTVTVSVPTWVPLDPALTASVPMPQPVPGMTNGDLLELAIRRGDALRQANRQLDAIRELQPHD